MFLSLLVSFFFAHQVAAADPKLTIRDGAYAAKFVSQSIADPITIEAGQTKTITIKFKNTGTATWNNTGSRFISAYTVEPKYRDSDVQGKNWISSSQTGKMAGTVKPGAVGELTIDLTAPQTAGEYTEQFYLSAENYSWVKGSYFFLKIKVTPSTAKPVATAPTPTETPAQPTSQYKANVFMKSPIAVTAAGGEQVQFTVAFQNIGTSAWNEYTILGSNPSALASVSTLSFADELWEGPGTVFTRAKPVEKNAVVRETFTFRTPGKVGSYTAAFRVAVNNEAVDGGLIQIPVTVTENAPNYVDNDAVELPQAIAPRLTEEPRIKVGIWKNPPGFVQFHSEDDDYYVYEGDILRGTLRKAYVGVLKYADGQYSFKGDELEFSTPSHIRLLPVNNQHAVFTLMNFSRVIQWKGGSRNFNKYRGGFEYRMTKDGDAVYAINDVLFEDYIAGIGETSNTDPIEFQKAQAVTARSYAYYVKEHTDKHEKRNFDVVATTGDQLYLGFISEGITPNYVAAVQATRGYMVIYENNIVITPYFGHSNGKTKSWVQVWGGVNRPWLVPVTAKYDKGLAQYGHGVGMSQRDAAQRAKKDGALWEDLIKIYYTGVTVEKVYN